MPKSTDPEDHDMAKVFARIPRPQKVLGTGKIVVPTASTLRQQAAQVAKVRTWETPSISARTIPGSGERSSTERTKSSMQKKDLTPKRPDTSPIEAHETRPLGPMITLGVLTQNNVRWALRAQSGRNGLIMVKRTKPESGKREQDIIQAFNHRNIAKLVHSSVNNDGSFSLALEYCRCTLAEILFVHLKLEETQIQYVARSVSLLLLPLSQFF